MRPVVSAAAEQHWGSLGTWRDRDGEGTGWALLHMSEALVGPLQIVNDLARDTDEGPGWSRLLDLDRTPDYALRWLSQFAGARVPSGMADADVRDLIRTRPGRARGRPAAIIAAVQSVLLGSKRVHLIERDTSAYHFIVQTYESQTPDPAAVVSAVRSVKPGGVMFAHEILVGATYAEVDAATADTYAARKATFPTYEDVAEYVP